MKYLRKFNESVEEIDDRIKAKEETDELISILEYMVLDISDKDLRVKINYVNNTRPKSYEASNYLDIEISISKNKEMWYREAWGKFMISEVSSEIFQIVDFMKEQGYEFLLGEISDPAGIYRAKIEDGKIVSSYGDEKTEINHLIGELRVRFTKSK